MKVLTVLFLVYYIYLLLNQQGFLGTSARKLMELLPSERDDEPLETVFNEVVESEKTEVAKQGCLVMIATFFTFLLAVLEFIYIIIATNKGGMIGVAYLILWIVLLLKSILKGKKNKDTNILKIKDNLNKFSVKLLVMNIIDLMYFGYMFYIFFIK